MINECGHNFLSVVCCVYLQWNMARCLRVHLINLLKVVYQMCEWSFVEVSNHEVAIRGRGDDKHNRHKALLVPRNEALESTIRHYLSFVRLLILSSLQQWQENTRCSSLSQEWMLEQLERRCSLRRIAYEHFVEEAAQSSARNT